MIAAIVGAAFEVAALDADALETVALLATQIEPAGGLLAALSDNPFVAFGALFAAGVLTSTNPCIWPMIPITFSVISGTAGEAQPRRRTVGLTLTYALGLALLYSVLGVIAGLSGTVLGAVGASFWALFATGNLLLFFSLFMLDVFPVRVPQRLLAWAGSRGGGSYRAVFILGATSGIVAAPCGAPAFAVVLTWVVAEQAGLMGFAYLFTFSIGMTAVLIVVGLFSGTLAVLPKSGTWMIWMKRAAALIMIGMAQFYLIRAGYFL